MKFVITETVPCVQVWTYEVEANNETEALEIVLNGDATKIESEVYEHDYENAQYEIEDEDGDIFDVERDEDDDEDDDNTQDNDEEGYDGASWDMQAR